MAGDSQEPIDGLVSLAQARFSELSDAETALLLAAPCGEVASCEGIANGDESFGMDPFQSDNWGPEREIRTELIRWLCVEREAASIVDPTGIQVDAARITGELDLSFVSVPFPLRFWRCRFTEDSNLTSAVIPELDLGGSCVAAVTADGAVIKGNLVLNNKFRAEGEFRLLGAQIGGDIECRDGAFENPHYDALSADRVSVQGSVFLHEGFRAEGGVRLVSARIGGNLVCTQGTFLSPGKNALSADRADVKGGVFLNEGFSAGGEVRLYGARIGGEIDCTDGTFTNPGGMALSADRADVKGSVFLSGKFTADGKVRLLGAQIGNNVDCSGGTFKNPGNHALSVDRGEVKGSVFVNDGFNAVGEVRLTSAQIGGDLECQDALFGELILESTAIRRTLFWRRAKATLLDLANASAGSLADDEDSWPVMGKLLLDGFVYGQFSGESVRDAETRLKWIELQGPFRPKPYRQLAKVLREMGDDPGARSVLFQLEHQRRREKAHSWHVHLRNWILKVSIGYGIYPLRAIRGIALLTALGWGLFWCGYAAHVMAPTDKDAYDFLRAHGYTPDYYQRFTASVYSLEHALPLVVLGQKDRWMPDPNPQSFRWLPGLLRCFRWAEILLGWVLASLFVAGVTGLVRKE